MNILFLCGGLEMGRDGVGDYARRLCAELIRLGCQTKIVALHDSYVKEIVFGEQQCGDFTIPIMRIPRVCTNENRMAEISKYAQKFQPQWVSLQFVPFSFNNKGLVVDLHKLILHIKGDARLHIMIHELWVGMNKEASLKFKIWGTMQKLLINNFLKRTQPRLITTQATVYKMQLSNLGYKPRVLRLFSNIPSAGRSRVISDGKNDINLVVFGTIQYDVSLASFASEAMECQVKTGKKVVLNFLGRCGREQENWLKTWSNAGLASNVYGELSPKIISEKLTSSDFGICSTSFAVIEKSGSYAAMKAHGLPVICISKPWTVAGFNEDKEDKDLLEYREGNLHSCLEHKKLDEYGYQVNDIAAQFITYLESNDKF